MPPSLTIAKTSITTLGSQPPGGASTTAPHSGVGAKPSLTEQQKRIVNEFKQNMARMPPDQQARYLAENKVNLLRQLNFQPHQLQLLQQRLQVPAPRPQPPQVLRTPRPPPPALPLAGSATLNTAGIKIPTMGGLGIQPLSPAPTVIGLATTQRLPSMGGQVNAPTDVLQTRPSTPLGVRRPAAPETSGQSLAKQRKIAFFESQLKKDQNEALNPNYKAPFGSIEDACKRLLRYHVFDELDPHPAQVMEEEDDFEDKSQTLLNKFHGMLNKYHYLLIKESMRSASSSEEVMLARAWDSDERQLLTQERELVKNGELLGDLQLSPELNARYKELVKLEVEDVKPEPILNPPEVVKEEVKPVFHPQPPPELLPPPPAAPEDSPDEDSKSDGIGFLGLKFSRNVAGGWIKEASGADYDYQFEAIMDDATKDNDDDSDEEFSLRDVDTDRAVGSILEGHDDSNASHVDLFEDNGDADSVQNAINSILDTMPQGERMDTPDMDNIAGFLDSIDDVTGADGADPVTEAAVNNIPQF